MPLAIREAGLETSFMPRRYMTSALLRPRTGSGPWPTISSKVSAGTERRGTCFFTMTSSSARQHRWFATTMLLGRRVGKAQRRRFRRRASLSPSPTRWTVISGETNLCSTKRMRSLDWLRPAPGVSFPPSASEPFVRWQASRLFGWTPPRPASTPSSARRSTGPPS